MAAATKTEEIIEPRRVTVGFERSVSVRPYETEKASIFVQVDVGPNDTTEQILEAVHAEYVGAKSEVYHQLGINSDKRLMAPGGRPIDIIHSGEVVKGLLG